MLKIVTFEAGLAEEVMVEWSKEAVKLI